MSVTGAGAPERIEALFVTDGTLAVLGVQPALGRRFSREDVAQGTPERVLLTHGYWQRKLGSDPAVLGRPLVVDGTSREITGVLPARFKFLNSAPQIVLPFRFDRAKLFIGNFSYQGLARLKPGVTLPQANADIARMLPLVIERFPLPSGFTRQMFDSSATPATTASRSLPRRSSTGR